VGVFTVFVDGKKGPVIINLTVSEINIAFGDGSFDWRTLYRRSADIFI
jgi:hypothetical protein